MGQASASSSSSTGINNAGAGTIGGGFSPLTVGLLIAGAVLLFLVWKGGK